jgi:hypothetical protein
MLVRGCAATPAGNHAAASREPAGAHQAAAWLVGPEGPLVALRVEDAGALGSPLGLLRCEDAAAARLQGHATECGDVVDQEGVEAVARPISLGVSYGSSAGAAITTASPSRSSAWTVALP